MMPGAIADCGCLLKKLSGQIDGMSAPNFFKISLVRQTSPLNDPHIRRLILEKLNFIGSKPSLIDNPVSNTFYVL